MGDVLIERLNAEECIGVGASGEPLMCLTNPDGPEAGMRIAELEAKLATAVGALERGKRIIHDYYIDDEHNNRAFKRMIENINQALASIQERT